MKTPIEEIERRKKEWKDASDKFKILEEKSILILKKCEEAAKKKSIELGISIDSLDNSILEEIWKPYEDFLDSDEWEKSMNSMGFRSPIYELSEEDIENMDFELPWGTKLKDSGNLLLSIEEKRIGTTIFDEFGHPSIVKGVAFDYEDYYWILHDILLDRDEYVSMVGRLCECNISENDKYAWSSDPIWNEDKSEVIYHDKKYTKIKERV